MHQQEARPSPQCFDLWTLTAVMSGVATRVGAFLFLVVQGSHAYGGNTAPPGSRLTGHTTPHSSSYSTGYTSPQNPSGVGTPSSVSSWRLPAGLSRLDVTPLGLVRAALCYVLGPPHASASPFSPRQPLTNNDATMCIDTDVFVSPARRMGRLAVPAHCTVGAALLVAPTSMPQRVQLA